MDPVGFLAGIITGRSRLQKRFVSAIYYNDPVYTAGVFEMETVSDSFDYAGYHRMSLANNISLPKGSIIGIVVLQRRIQE